MPPLWHWAYFPELVPLADLGTDGHPRRHDELVHRFPRRMAGGGSVRHSRGLLIGEPAERHSELVEMRERRGRSGELVICDWRHTVVQGGVSALEEIQSVIYRGPKTESSSEPGPERDRRSSSASAEFASEEGSWRFVRQVDFDPVMLFRFSAVTWNSHRIHYDRRYATEQEGYPGLVVHGPLVAMLLAREVEQELGKTLSLDFRLLAPTFDADVVELYLRRTDESGSTAEARRPDGTRVASLSATTSPT